MPTFWAMDRTSSLICWPTADPGESGNRSESGFPSFTRVSPCSFQPASSSSLAAAAVLNGKAVELSS